MNILEVLNRVPRVEIDEKELGEILKDQELYAKQNIHLFKDSILSLAFYQIYKGNHKDNMIYLYMDVVFTDEDNPTDIQSIYFGVQESGVCTGEDHGTFDTIEAAVKKFKMVTFRYECLPVYRVYEATLKGETETFLFSVNEMREVSLREDVKNGILDIDLDNMKLIKETEDRNEAKSMATEF